MGELKASSLELHKRARSCTFQQWHEKENKTRKVCDAEGPSSANELKAVATEGPDFPMSSRPDSSNTSRSTCDEGGRDQCEERMTLGDIGAVAIKLGEVALQENYFQKTTGGLAGSMTREILQQPECRNISITKIPDGLASEPIQESTMKKKKAKRQVPQKPLRRSPRLRERDAMNKTCSAGKTQQICPPDVIAFRKRSEQYGRRSEGAQNEYSVTTYTPPKQQRLYTRDSNIHVLGLFTDTRIEMGTEITTYFGEIISERMADRREKKYLSRGLRECYFMTRPDNMVIDATEGPCLAKFLNHCCTPNTTVVAKENKLFIVSTRDISRGEELTLDYMFNEAQEGEERIECKCLATSCRTYLN